MWLHMKTLQLLDSASATVRRQMLMLKKMPYWDGLRRNEFSTYSSFLVCFLCVVRIRYKV